MCCVLVVCSLFCFFKQKSAYEMRIRDWSSDVCSSDLQRRLAVPPAIAPASPMPLPEPRWIAVPRLDPGYAQDLLAVAVTELCPFERSEERRVGKECVSTCRYRWVTYP